MAIITISRGCFSHGREIAEKIAARLDYACISREILIEASQCFDIPEKKLLTSLHDAPTLLERFTHTRDRYLACIQAALLDHVTRDNVVYHGHAGHLLLRGFPRILKVRIIAATADRVRLLLLERHITADEAQAHIRRDDQQRACWTRFLYQKEVNDPALYDIVITVGSISIDDACDLIVNAVDKEAFRLTAQDRGRLTDLAIESRLKVLLADICSARIRSSDGVVHVRCSPQRIKKFDPIRPDLASQLDATMGQALGQRVRAIAADIPGVKEVVCDVEAPHYA